jgi:hypothetical protein
VFETKNAKDSKLLLVQCELQVAPWRLKLSASPLPWANKGVVSHFAKLRKSNLILSRTDAACSAMTVTSAS